MANQPLFNLPGDSIGMSQVSIDSHAILYGSLALFGLVTLHRNWNSAKSHPPSPWSLPILGNLFSIPSGMEHIAYMKLGKQLNTDIIYLRLFGHNFVVINSAQTATEILEKRSRLYSDRLTPPMFKDPSLLNWGGHSVLTPYSDLWRIYRRAFNNWLNARAATQFHQLQEHQARLLLQRLINLQVPGDPNPFEQMKRSLYYTMASSTLRLAYGYELQGDNDQVFHNINQTSHYTALAAMFTNFFVNIFPSLTYVPDWFPGTGWKQTAREWRAFKDHAQSVPYEWTKAQLAAGTAEPSILSMLLQDHSLTSGLSAKEKESCLKEIALMIVAAGTDTTATALVSFVAAMVLNPHVQTKAQKEIDDVLGPMSLPTMTDRERLPYIRNLIQEVLRWQPPAPTGVPHACWQDDVYRGYDIERGTVVIGNMWAMTRDESVYKDPEVFDPDRFLDSAVPYGPAFGWGRRKCAGIHFAESSLFILVASLLATFRFCKKKGSDGQEITPQLELVSNSIIMELKPFEFEVELRSDKHRQLILEYNDH